MAIVFEVDAGNPASYSGSGSTWADVSGNGNDVTLFNTPTWDSRGYLKFNGTNQYGSFSDAALPLGTGNRTVAMWARYDSYDTGYRNVLAYGTYTNNQLVAVGTYNNQYFFNGYASDNYGGTTSRLWAYLVGTFDGTTCKLYVNGVLVASNPRAWNTVSSGAAYIARQVTNIEYGPFSIGYVKVYDTVLTQAQIEATYASEYQQPRFYGNVNPVMHVDAANPASYSGSGTTWTDLSGNGHNVTLSGSPTWDSNGWFTFDGTGAQYGSIAATSTLPLGKDAMTMMGWVYQNAITGSIRVVAEYGTAATDQVRAIAFSNNSFYGAGYSNDFSVGGATTGRWYQLAMSYDGTNARLFVNGSLVSTTNKSGWNLVDSGFGYLARNILGTLPQDGRIAEFRIYDRAVPESEMQSLYAARQAQYNPATTVNPIASFDAISYPGTGTTWSDLSGNGRDATLFNSPQWDSTTGYFKFTGTEYATFSSTGLPSGGNPRSLEIWMLRSASDDKGSALFYGAQSTSQAFAVGQYFYSTNRTYGYGWNDDVYAESAWTPSRWYHIVFTYDNAVAKLYQNGVEIARGTKAFSTVLTNVLGQKAIIGNRPDLSLALTGKVAIVKAYDRVLSPSEIQANYLVDFERFQTIDSNVSFIALPAYLTYPDRISPDTLAITQLIFGAAGGETVVPIGPRIFSTIPPGVPGMPFPITPRYFITFRHSDTGLNPTFVSFKNANTFGDISPPLLTESPAGGGVYYFDWAWTSKNDADIVFEVDGGSGITTDLIRYVKGTISPRDRYLDVPASQVANDVWDVATASHASAGSFGKELSDVSTAVGAISVPTSQDVADAVWDTAFSAHTASGSFGAKVSDTYTAIDTTYTAVTNLPSAVDVADEVWSASDTGWPGASMGNSVIGNLLTAVSNTTSSSIASSVWDATAASYVTSGSLGEAVVNIKDHALGKWEIKLDGPDANRLVLYKADGVTVLKKFNLTDSDGNPTAVNPYTRTPV